MNESTTVITESSGLSAAARLEEVEQAIHKILLGGQSYKIGSRSLTRADLSLLREMQKELKAEAAQEAATDTGFFDDTYVAVFTDTR